ncbi:DUF2378 family protein [Archangium lipolyticum]|uniref:DUF2378 family protein n=1 Tax=Archangium lipolyticum TaxID=2970465 RepID=UPI00214A497A|nr:DUF2378 family protein [Archangium lipolyticum]
MLRRIALAPPEARTQAQFLTSALSYVEERLGPGAVEEVRAVAPSLEGGAAFNLPVAEQLRVMDAAVGAVERQLGISYAVAMEELGVFSGRRFVASALGRAMWKFPGGDMQQILAATTASARAATSHGERAYEKLGANSARLLFKKEVTGPAWIRGMYRELIRSVAGFEPTAILTDYRDPGADFNLVYTW